MPSVLDLLILLFLVVVFGVKKLNIVEYSLIHSFYIYTYISLFQICCCYHFKMIFFCLFSTILLLCIIAFDIFSNNYDILQIAFFELFHDKLLLPIGGATDIRYDCVVSLSLLCHLQICCVCSLTFIFYLLYFVHYSI
jgi:hypothetical protein